ncbi:MAG: ISNCY family transposase [Chloroflexota bacterium]
MPTLSLQALMRRLRERWSSLPDRRKPNNNQQYTIADGVLSAFAVFFMQSSSFLAHQRLLQSTKGRNNARSLFQVTEIPSDTQIRNLVDPLSNTEFATDFWYVLDELKRQQQLLRFQNELQTYAIALDGVNFFSSEKISCAKCLKRTDRAGAEHFYHSAVTPVFVKPGTAQVLPLPPEFIVPQDGQEKQDCERSAAKRWLAQCQGHFAAHSVTYLGDDLYANQPLCQLLAETYQQFFVFVCKPESHEGLYQWLDFLDKNRTLETLTQRHWNGKRGELWQYRFALQVPLRNGDDALLVNWFEVVITDEKAGNILYQNSFVTNHPVTADNVAELVQVGRSRWKIENENNNTLKTKGYHFEHNFGHGSQDLANVLATLNLLAFLLHTVQELLTPAYQRLRQALGARKTFFNDLRALTRYLVFDSWDDLLRFMEEGLEIAPAPP